jgi:uncharacterized membrane protein YdjX (TVP38/TMEM64 family)
MKSRLPWMLAVPVGLATVAAVYLLLHPGWIAPVAAYWQGLGPQGLWLYGLLYILATIFFVPCSPFILAAGFLFGVVKGSLLMSVGSVISAGISFLFARSWGREWAASKLARHRTLAAFDAALRENGFKVVTLLWLQPVFIPFVYLNLALGITKVRTRDFLLGTLTGMFPGIVLYVYVGSLVRSAADLSLARISSFSREHSLIFWAGFLATLLLVTLLTRMARQALVAHGDPAKTTESLEAA